MDNSINTIESNVRNFGLFAWLYENESAHSSRRNKQAKRVKAQRGLFVGSIPSYGYKSKNAILKTKTDETPDTIRCIFEKYLSGISMDTIAKTLTDEGVPTPSQVAKKTAPSMLWHASSIKVILKNRHYCGDLVQNRSETITVTSIKRRELCEEDQVIIEATLEPFIPKETFNAVQTLMKTSTRSSTAPKKQFSRISFTAMSVIKVCGLKRTKKVTAAGETLNTAVHSA